MLLQKLAGISMQKCKKKKINLKVYRKIPERIDKFCDKVF